MANSINQSDAHIETPLVHRYGFKTLSQVVGMFLSLVTLGVVPKVLGPSAYGVFTLISDLFGQTIGLLDSGISSAFLTKLSQRPKDEGLRFFFWLYIAAVSLVAFVVSLFFYFTRGSVGLFADVSGQLLIAGVAVVLTIWINSVFEKWMDAFGLTVPAENLRIVFKVVYTVAIVLLAFFQKLNLWTFFAVQGVVSVLQVSAWAWVVEKRGIRVFPRHDMGRKGLHPYFKEFYAYVSPLIIYSAVGVFSSYCDRIFLQRYGGSEEQGFFGFGKYVAGICFTLVAPMAPLIQRELARSLASDQKSEAGTLLEKYIPSLYFVAAYFSVFIFCEADLVVHILGGEKYVAGVGALRVLSLYPLTQVFGQLLGALFFASAATQIYANLGLFFALIGIPVSYVLLSVNMGFHLGAMGLGLKTVILSWMNILVLLYFSSRFVTIKRMSLFIDHIKIPLLLGVCSVLSRVILGLVFTRPFPLFFATGVLYSVMALGLFHQIWDIQEVLARFPVLRKLLTRSK